MKRVQFKNLELIEEMYNRKKSAIGAIGHCGNFEWMPPMLQMHTRYMGYAIVKPLTDKFFDDYVSRMRSRFIGDGHMVHYKQTLRHLLKRRDELNFTLFVADQTPHKDEINYWTSFLNQNTPFFLSIEKIAKSLDLAVFFLDTQRVKRGHYHVVIHNITDTPKETGEFWITNEYIRMLESSIRKHPDNWLWSHRRWKYQMEGNPD